MLAEVAARVRCRHISARELVAESLTRIARDDPTLNAVVRLRAEEALADAEKIDKRIANGEDPGPLAGLPVLVKELDDVAGLPTTHGSCLLADAAPASADSRVPALLRAAGGVIVGKSNIPEFCFEGHSCNPLFGATRNPWSVEYTPGGSSGGSGAALAAGMVAVATATDGGGSIRIPAAFCGLVGLKPTNGRIGRGATPAWLDLTTDGPLTHTVADARLLLDIESGPAAGDIYAAPDLPPPPACLPARVLAAPRLSSTGPLPEAVEGLFAAALEALQADLRLPVAMTNVASPFGARTVDEDWYVLSGAEQAHALGAKAIEEHASLFDAVFLETMRAGLSVTTEEYVAARRRRWDYARALDELLAGETVLVCPTMNVEGILADGHMPGENLAAPVRATPGWAYNTNLANMTGAPAISLPAGRCPSGVPFGLQVIAGRYREDLLFGLAEAWERARPWPLLAEGYAWFVE